MGRGCSGAASSSSVPLEEAAIVTVRQRLLGCEQVQQYALSRAPARVPSPLPDRLPFHNLIWLRSIIPLLILGADHQDPLIRTTSAPFRFSDGVFDLRYGL